MYLLTSGLTFGIIKYEYFTENKNVIKYKHFAIINIEHYQN